MLSLDSAEMNPVRMPFNIQKYRPVVKKKGEGGIKFLVCPGTAGFMRSCLAGIDFRDIDHNIDKSMKLEW
jgi:hypothetical protein